ncbi:EAL domain-containing protein [Geminocystis sp. NIES-3709]|uniref:EAL domain-containing protein n=1 Tax=Geminocystis sp. NIES-3709 TaxID=1617448 RepID=UPI0005FCDA67|nr:EAL domain-containing protein [Geminocystis sp. NIES-3709]BAQ65057.1 diguanylate cyclase/phosphodiesterase with PAS/PAC sensor [Geminocystis sp. NIES-3709]
MDQFITWLVIITSIILINFWLIKYIYNLKQKNLNLTIEKDEYKYHLFSLREKEKELSNQNLYNLVILKAKDIIINTLDIDNIYNQIIELINDTLNINLSYLLKFEKNKQYFVIQSSKGWNLENKTDYKINLFDHNFIEIFNTKKLFIIDDIEDLKRKLEHIDYDNKKAIKSAIHFNIIDPITKEKIAILGLYIEENNKFNNPEIEFVQNIITVIQQGIKNISQSDKLTLLERAINNSTNGIVISEAKEGNPIIYTNLGFEKITGYSGSEAFGKNCKFLQGENTNQEEVNKLRQAIISQDQTKAILCNYRKNGEQFWNEVYLSPVYNHYGKVTHFIGIQNDITEKYNIEQSLLKKTRELELFNRQLHSINNLNNINYDTIDNPLNYYLENITNILNIDISIISEYFGEKHRIIALYNYLSNDNLFIQENHLINVLAHEVLIDEKTIIYDRNLDTNSLLNLLIPEELNITLYLGTPIWIDNQFYGVLHLFRFDNSKSESPIQDTLIESITQAIERIILREETELEKQQINIALKESQERLNDILFSLEDVIWSIHPQTLQLTYINPAAEFLFNSPLSNFFQKRAYWLELVHPKQQQKIKEIYSNLFNISLLGDNLESHDIEYKILLKNGEEKYIRDRAHVVYDDKGKVIRIDGIITDITNKTKIQKALEKSEEEFRLIFELAPIGMMITDLEGKIIQVNQSLSELLQYPLSDIINQKESRICHPDDREKCSLFKQKIITEYLDQDTQERRFLAHNSSVVHTIVNASALRNNRGEIIQFIQQIIDISELKIMEEQIFYDAFHDKLTGLPNRFLLMDRLKQFLNRNNKNYNSVCAILLIDVDNFKKINDSLGHKIGDELLVLITDKIADCVRENDTVARISGDEFVVFLPDINSEKDSYEIAGKILTACKFNIALHGNTVFSSVSIGITLSSFGYKKSEEMIRDADLAMYQAKESGRNCYRIFNPTMHTDLVKRLSLESALRKALDKEELELFYQPIINLKTGIIAGFEALIRWNSATHGLISPVEFIPIAEETGLIISLGNWILDTAAKEIKKWENKYPELKLFTAVNVSSKQLLNPNFLIELDEILATTKVNPYLLKIEITETILMNNYDHAKDILTKIQERNLKISLDDFGTGYSSLSYLHRLPFNTLKIDRAFIQPLIHPQQKNPIVEAIVTLAHNLSLDVVAEGIETKIQEQILRKINCNYGQGYLYSKPINARNAGEFIDQELEKLKRIINS